MSRFADYLKSNESAARELLAASDYREFLRSCFKFKKIINPSYSYAVFARQANVAKSLPRDIIEGLKRLTDKNLQAFALALELDGLLSEYFTQLYALETNPSHRKILERIKALYIETHFSKTFGDGNFENFKSPFLYAASGDVGVGAKIEDLAKRTGLDEDEIRATLPFMESVQLGKFIREESTFVPATPQVHVTPLNSPDHFMNFYLFCLNLQKEHLRKKFFSEEALFYNEVFSVDRKDLPAMKQEMKKLIRNFLIQAENSQGDSVAVVNVGFFRQNFSGAS